jgi:A/G-specific adenine glycosylase
MRQRTYPSCELGPEVVERISWLREQLLCWFERSGRSFPWREPDRTSYEVILAEILLQHLAQFIEERSGIVPSSRAELERMRGIGPYTASAVLAIVYGQAEPLVDVNTSRLLERFFGSSGDTQGSRQRLLHALALCLVGGERSLEVNWAALDCGALVCKARRPLCLECPLQARCQYFTQQEL